MEAITPRSLFDKLQSPVDGAEAAIPPGKIPQEWMLLSPFQFEFDGWEGDHNLGGLVDGSRSQSLFQAQQDRCENECLAVVVGNIQKLCRAQQDVETYALGDLLQIIQEAVRASEKFADCTSSCRQTHLLLYITVLQQIETLYTYLTHHMIGNNTQLLDLSVQLKIGDFVVDTVADANISRTLLIAGLQKALNCTSRLVKDRQGNGVEKDMHGALEQDNEISCGVRMLEDLRTTFDRDLKGILIS